MPLPGDNKLGRRKGSYTPGDDNLDSTPFKPVPLTFQQADGTMPADGIDQNRNAKNGTTPTARSAHRQPATRENRKKLYCIAAAIVIGILLLLIIILPLAICFGTDLCSSSSSSSTAEHKRDRVHQAELRGTLTAPIIPDPGNGPFGEHLNRTLEANATTTSTAAFTTVSTMASTETAAATINHRRKRNMDNGNGTVDPGSVSNSTELPSTNRSIIDKYLMDMVSSPLLESIKLSPLCQNIDCTDLAFDDMVLHDDVMTSGFHLHIGSDEPLSIDPAAMDETVRTTAHNFSDAFNNVFPGYRLGDVNLEFDLASFCNFTSILCVNFTDINDTMPTSSAATTTANDTETTTSVTDRSVLLPDIVQIFNFTSSDRSISPTTISTVTGSSASVSSTLSTMAQSTMPAVVPAVNGMADCSKYGFPCANQKDRIPVRQRCDGVIQCPDGSDEQLCDQCRTAFSCPNGDGSWMCLQGKVLCDGKSSCLTKVDEQQLHCRNSCLSSEYQCRDANICIPKRWLCDGDTQCPQGDDEADCNSASKCNNNGFFCQADLRCIAYWNFCNGVADCSDGADEIHCSCVECSGNSTALCSAPYGKCIQSKQICDGKPDCPNGEDEMKCRS